MPVIQACVHRDPVYELNGKSLALRDAIDPSALAQKDPFPHRFMLTKNFREDCLLDLGFWVFSAVDESGRSFHRQLTGPPCRPCLARRLLAPLNGECLAVAAALGLPE